MIEKRGKLEGSVKMKTINGYKWLQKKETGIIKVEETKEKLQCKILHGNVTREIYKELLKKDEKKNGKQYDM